jgi:hypothetical protein
MPFASPGVAEVPDAIVVEPSFFNSTLGQSAEMRFSVQRPSKIEGLGRGSRRLPDPCLVRAGGGGGLVMLGWGGCDDDGAVVPDEACSVRVALDDGGGVEVCDPLLVRPTREMAFFATPLPSGALMTVGNRQMPLAAYALAYRPEPAKLPHRWRLATGRSVENLRWRPGRDVSRFLWKSLPDVALQAIG